MLYVRREEGERLTWRCVCLCRRIALKAVHRWEAKQLIVIQLEHVYILFQCTEPKDSPYCTSEASTAADRVSNTPAALHWEQHMLISALMLLRAVPPSACRRDAVFIVNTVSVTADFVWVGFKEAVFQSLFLYHLGYCFFFLKQLCPLHHSGYYDLYKVLNCWNIWSLGNKHALDASWKRGRETCLLYLPQLLMHRIMFFLSDDRRGEESALRLNKRTRDCFPQWRVRREGGLSWGTL